MDVELEAAQRVGTTLCHKWTLERLIGTGGMAAVYEAVHKIGRREAIKILHADVARDAEVRARFEQEAHVVNRFKHPGAVDVRDIDVTEDGTPFLVMELLQGDSLADLSRRREALELGVVLRLADELLDVLVAAHAQGIIHRDIKPDNLFVQKDGRLKVLDFGIARVRAGVPLKLRTRAGATLGTAPYMPPEQIKGQEIDARADVFAVGATLFRILARRRVHEAPTETETLVRMASEPAPPLGSVAPDVPRDVCLVVDRALMFDRAQRYPDAATMQSDIRAVREGQPPPYAHARLLEGTPAPSAMRAPALIAPVSAHPEAAPASAPPPTAAATPVGPLTAASPDRAGSPVERTAAASPVALLQSASPAAEVEAAAPLSSSRQPTPEPPTRTMTPVGAAAPPDASGAPIAQIPITPVATGGYVPGAERTMRSEQSPEGLAPPRAAGYIVATTPVLPVARPAGSSPGSRTVPAGTEPAPPEVPDSIPSSLLGRPGAGPLPGESIPVVRPPRTRTFAGAEPNVGLLILVGIVFAALGVGLTLWFMLRGPGEALTAGAAASASAEPAEPVGLGPAFPGIHQRPTHTAAPPHQAPPPGGLLPSILPGGGLPPQHEPGKSPHGKGHNH